MEKQLALARRFFSRFARDTCGSSAIITALLAVVVLWCAAFAVDVGSLYFERRTAQGAVDLAAIAAASDIDSAERAAMATLKSNGIGNIENMEVTRGHYRADPSLPAGERFVPNEEPFNAVQVSLSQNAPLYLAGALAGMNSMNIGTRAIAVQTQQAAFSIGSRLLRLEGGLANALLGALLGGSLKLTVMDYEALAQANVKLFSFMDALATELKVEGASYNEVLEADATVGNILDAMTTVTAKSGQAGAAQALRGISASTNSWGTTVPLGNMIDLGPYGYLSGDTAAPGFDPSVNVMQMVSAAAGIANGDSQVSLNLGAAIPGLADVRVDIAIGEPMQHSPWLRVGERGAVVRTAQTRIRVLASVGGAGGALPLSVRIPLYAEIAYAEGRLDDISCSGDSREKGRVDVAALPGVAELWLGDINPRKMGNFSSQVHVRKAHIVDTRLARVSGKAHAAMTNVSETILTFDWYDIEEQRIKSTSTHDSLTTLLGSLMRDIDLDVKVGGLSLGLPGAVTKTVANVLAAATPALDRLLGGVLETLGITIGEADISVRGLRCDGAALVG